MLTREFIRGKAAGAAILTLFGALWCMLALGNWSGRPGWSIPAVSAATIMLLFLCVMRLIASGKIAKGNDPAAAEKGKRAGILFGIIFGIEGALIGLSSALLASHGRSDWIPLVAAFIIGVHFIPLARLFDVPLYYWTGSLSVLGVLGSLLIPDIGVRILCLSLGMTTILWLTVAALLWQMRPTTGPLR